jgi:hypothetical protein
MEVHHHPHVEKKSFKEYFLEFLMIFLAVSMGFFAENIRESIVNNHKEKEYIRSLIKDLEADTAKLNQSLPLNIEQSKGYDSLINYWYSKPYSDSSIRYMYYLYRKYTGTRHKVWFTHRTIDQLKNAGGMSLIQSKAASDSTINYYESVDRADGQIEIFTNTFQHDALQTSYHIFDWSLLRDVNVASSKKILSLEKKFNFLNANVSDQNTYIGQLQVANAVLRNYIRMLSDEQKGCLRLISILEKEYHLE